MGQKTLENWNNCPNFKINLMGGDGVVGFGTKNLANLDNFQKNVGDVRKSVISFRQNLSCNEGIQLWNTI